MLLGVVIIGRNEGERLRRCLASVLEAGALVVYVDSGSTDGSVELARQMGTTVAELDQSIPFSAARARNAGFERLVDIARKPTFVQFVDGDCEISVGWLERAARELEARPDVAVVCGRVLERHPEASFYNRLCALEWERPAGEIRACGGIFMVRTEAFEAADGFREDVIAAEDDELCLRLRRNGGKILAVDADMCWHDAAMMRFGQWWQRAKRAGHAYAQGAAMHGRSPERHFIRDCRRIWFWGLVLPLLALALAWWTSGLSLLLLGAYALLAVRVYQHGRRRGWSASDTRLYAFFTVLAKFPGLLGMLQYHRNQWRGRRSVLIEYKGVGKPA